MNSASSPAALAPQGLRTALLAVVDNVTPSLRAAAVRVRRLLGQAVSDDDEGGTESPRLRSDVLVAGPNLRFFHRSSCPMAADREWSATPANEHSRAGRAPCGMCTP